MPKGNIKSPVVKSPAKRRSKSKPKSPAVKSPVVLQKKASRKRTMLKEQSFRSYIYRLMKHVHPGLAISKQGMEVVNSMIVDLFERIACEAGLLTRINHRSTLSSRDIEGAVKLVVPSELGKFAVAAGKKALATYNNSYNMDMSQMTRVSQEH